MGEVALAVVEIGSVLALIVAVAYYRSKAKDKQEEAAVATSQRDAEVVRADAVEKLKAEEDLRSFEDRKAKAKNATIDDAISAWVESGKLFPGDKDR